MENKDPQKLIAELQEKLSAIGQEKGALVNEIGKLKGVLSSLGNIPEVEGLKKTAEDLTQFATKFEPILKALNNLPPEVLEQLKKAK